MRPKHQSLLIAALALLLLQGVLQWNVFPLWRKNYAPKQAIPVGLSPEQLLLVFAGFREFMAGVLWVRADGFFHSGNYDAILPMLRLVTWLDPHQVDIYSTGAWHMGYNFTDESQRSDRRYIVPALKFLDEGIENNPNLYELYFEKGWIYYHKIQDPVNASVWLAKANQFPDMIEARRNILAHALEKSGYLQQAADEWTRLVETAEKIYQKNPSYENNNLRDTRRNNYEQLLMRIVRRYGEDAETQPPVDLMFDAKVTVVRPRVLLVEGTLNIPTIGCRVDVILHNKGFKMEYDPAKLEVFSFEVDRDLTYMQDSLAVRGSKFKREIDMSKDPKMYPFTAKEYELVVSFNPRYASPNIQDRLGWTGEGLTDKNYLDTSQFGVRKVTKVLTLTREQILMLGSR